MKVTAIVGTYRKNGVVDRAVDEVLAAAQAAGAETNKIYLLDRHIEFCTNCRSCTQQEGTQPGVCPINDDVRPILDEIERSDAIILASPMNFWSVTALMKRFIERLICFAYWPWGKAAPKLRGGLKTKRAVVIASSAAPAVLVRLLTRMVGLMKSCAKILGAKQVQILFIGLVGSEQQPDLGRRATRRARKLGQFLAGR